MSNLLHFDRIDGTVDGDNSQPRTEYERRFHDLVEGSLQGIMVTRGSQVIFANQALASMFGYTVDELVKLECWEELVAPDERKRVASYCSARDQGEAAPDRYEYQAVRKDGSLLWLENLSRRVSWNGQAATQATVIDITERKLAEVQLRESERRSQEFAADIAHELRTPLAVLSMRLESFADLPEVKDLRGDVESMSRLINQLLTLARLDRLVIDMRTKVDLHAVCVDVASLLAPLIIEGNKTIEVVADGSSVYVHGDHDCLARAVCNLVENACKHSDDSEVIKIVVGADASISVVDHGPGVTAAKREQIFKRLQQADDKTDGFGLGLSIVQRIVEAHGGTISLSDTPGGGATFTLDFANARC